jgi:glycosyltransferase involved in cell wall biosynthesis
MTTSSSGPVISVVIPCYNAAATLTDTVDSALAQNVDLEVIIVDDGSTDASSNIIHSFGSRVRAEFGPNRGVSAARTRGMALARGRYIQYLDADDLLVSGTLERRLNALAITGADVAYTDWQNIVQHRDGGYQFGEIIVLSDVPIEHDSEAACANSFWAPPAALLYRRQLVDRIGWHPQLPIIQDARFLFDAAANGARFVHVPDVGAHYRISAGSLSRNMAQFIRDCFINAQEIETHWRQKGVLSETRQEALTAMWGHVAVGAFRQGMAEFSAARRAYNRVSRRRALIEAMWMLRILLGPSTAKNLERAIRHCRMMVGGCSSTSPGTINQDKHLDAASSYLFR